MYNYWPGGAIVPHRDSLVEDLQAAADAVVDERHGTKAAREARLAQATPTFQPPTVYDTRPVVGRVVEAPEMDPDRLLEAVRDGSVSGRAGYNRLQDQFRDHLAQLAEGWRLNATEQWLLSWMSRDAHLRSSLRTMSGLAGIPVQTYMLQSREAVEVQEVLARKKRLAEFGLREGAVPEKPHALQEAIRRVDSASELFRYGRGDRVHEQHNVQLELQKAIKIAESQHPGAVAELEQRLEYWKSQKPYQEV